MAMGCAWNGTSDRPKPDFPSGELDLLDFNVNITSVEFHFMGTRRLRGRHGERLAVADIKFGTVARAGDLATLDFTLAERATIMSANIIDTVKVSLHVKDDHESIIHFDQLHAPVRNLTGGASQLKITHQFVPFLPLSHLDCPHACIPFPSPAFRMIRSILKTPSHDAVLHRRV